MDATQTEETSEAGVREAGMTRYLREVGRARLLSHVEEKALLERVRAGDRRALNDLITGNLKRVVAICGSYRDRGLPMTDLIAEGNLGLIRAALTFDPMHAFRFTAYAAWWIRHCLERALADDRRHLGLKAAEAETIGKESGEGRAGPVPARAGRTSRGAGLEHPLSPEVQRALEGIREPGRTVLKLFFGLDAKRPLSLDEIGRLLGLGPLRARRIKDAALRGLQRVVQARAAGAAV